MSESRNLMGILKNGGLSSTLLSVWVVSKLLGRMPSSVVSIPGCPAIREKSGFLENNW